MVKLAANHSIKLLLMIKMDQDQEAMFNFYFSKDYNIIDVREFNDKF